MGRYLEATFRLQLRRTDRFELLGTRFGVNMANRTYQQHCTKEQI